MLRFVVDRFAHLRQPGQKLQFLELLLEVLEDYRIRSLQIWKTSVAAPNDYISHDGTLIDFVIADTLRFIQISVTNWEDEPVNTVMRTRANARYRYMGIRLTIDLSLISFLRLSPTFTVLWKLRRGKKQRHSREVQHELEIIPKTIHPYLLSASNL